MSEVTVHKKPIFDNAKIVAWYDWLTPKRCLDCKRLAQPGTTLCKKHAAKRA